MSGGCTYLVDDWVGVGRDSLEGRHFRKESSSLPGRIEGEYRQGRPKGLGSW